MVNNCSGWNCNSISTFQPYKVQDRSAENSSQELKKEDNLIRLITMTMTMKTISTTITKTTTTAAATRLNITDNDKYDGYNEKDDDYNNNYNGCNNNDELV